MIQTLSQMARGHARARNPDGPTDAIVAGAPADRDSKVTLRELGARRRYTLTVPWVSNGRLPAAGDQAIVISSPAGAIALVWATGAVL